MSRCALIPLESQNDLRTMFAQIVLFHSTQFTSIRQLILIAILCDVFDLLPADGIDIYLEKCRTGWSPFAHSFYLRRISCSTHKYTDSKFLCDERQLVHCGHSLIWCRSTGHFPFFGHRFHHFALTSQIKLKLIFSQNRIHHKLCRRQDCDCASNDDDPTLSNEYA